MRSVKVLLYTVFLLGIVFAEAQASGRGEMETRGKKKKIALFVYFADIVLKKIFVLKLIYAFVFWIVIHKAGYFLSWFVSYLKEKKHEHHSSHYHDHGPHSYESHGYGPHEYEPHGYGPHEYEPHGYGPHEYEPLSYGPYRRKGHGWKV